jgi:hypothetical protein
LFVCHILFFSFRSRSFFLKTLYYSFRPSAAWLIVPRRLLPFDASCPRRSPACWLFGPALLANGIDLHRAAQQRELPESVFPFDKSVRLRHLDITDLFALHAHHVVMRLCVAIVARAFMQGRYLASLADIAELFEDAMNGSQRDVGKFFAYGGADVLGAGMLFRGEECSDDGEPLRRDGQAASMAPLHELVQAASRIGYAPLSV